MQTFNVQGMTCAHCERAVTNAILALDAQARVRVDRQAGVVEVDGELSEAARAITLCDTVGAGDSFQAALLSYLHEQRLDSPTALAGITRDQSRALLAFAVEAAALTCSRRGPDLPHRYEFA